MRCRPLHGTRQDSTGRRGKGQRRSSRRPDAMSDHARTYIRVDAHISRLAALAPVAFLDAIHGVRAAAAQAGKAHPRVALCGERAGRLWAAGRTAEAAQLEQLCGELPQQVDILCAYPVPYTTDDEALTRICAEHTAVSAC